MAFFYFEAVSENGDRSSYLGVANNGMGRTN